MAGVLEVPAVAKVSTSALRRKRALRWLIQVLLVGMICWGITYRAWLLTVPVELGGDGAIRYHPLAVNLLAGNGFTTATSPPYTSDTYDVPGFPTFLALLLYCGGGSLQIVFVVHLLLELATLTLLYKTAILLCGNRQVATLAAILAFASPFVPSVSHNVICEPLALTLSTLFLYLLARVLTLGTLSVGMWIAVGLVAGAGILVRVDSYPLVCLGITSVAWSLRSLPWPRVLPRLAVTIVATGLVLLPWSIRNYTITGMPTVPGHEQYFGDHGHNGYRRWLATWMFDSKHVHSWLWHADGVPNPDTLPWYAAHDHEQRTRIRQAFAMIGNGQSNAELHRSQALGNPIGSNAQAHRIFNELAAERATESPWARIRTYVALPVLRLTFTWVRMPGMCKFPESGRLTWKVVVYIAWLATLAAALVGLRASFPVPGAFLLLLAFVFGRSIFPIVAVGGIEPRYLLPAVPALWVLAAMGLARWRFPEALGNSALSAETLDPGCQMRNVDN